MPALFKIFIVEDDPFYARLIQHHFGIFADCYTEIFLNGTELLQNLHRQPDIITLDYGLPDIEGVELLKKIKQYNAEISVVIVSGQNELTNAVNLFKAGAFDYVFKTPETMQHLLLIVEKLKEQLLKKREKKSMEKLLQQGYDLTKVYGRSVEVDKIISFVQSACLSSNPVLVQGEKGSGGVFIAKLIHYNSSQAKKPFAEHMLEYKEQKEIDAELFGFEKLYKADIQTRKKGKIDEANKGTLYIDEISNLGVDAQEMLLKLIQEKKFRRVGSSREVKANVRIIAFTKYNLLQKAEKGEFNKELYYALASLSIQLLPLRYRIEEVIPLAEYFVREHCEEMGIPHKIFSKSARKKLLNYSYPDNVSELRAIANQAVISSTGSIIDSENIILNDTRKNVFSCDMEYTLEQYNELIIKHYLNKHNNNVADVSKILNISKSTIYRLLKKEREISKEQNLNK